MKDESKHSSEHTHEDAFDVIDISETESINQALLLINHSEFEVIQVKKFQSANSYVQ